MDALQYNWLKADYYSLLEQFKNSISHKDIYDHLRLYIKFDKRKKLIHYNGNNDELIKSYFPLSCLTRPKEKKYEQRKNHW